MSKAKRKRFRHVFLQCILATDMSKHSKCCVSLENDIQKPRQEEGEWKDPELKTQSMQLLLSVAVHSADISNPTRPLELHRQWADNVMTEFFNQGDEERRLGLEIAPGCDRDSADICSVQLGFINFVVAPWFELWKTILPDLGEVFLLQLDENKLYWTKQVAEVMDTVSDEEAEEIEPSVDPSLPEHMPSQTQTIPTVDPHFTDSPSLRPKRSLGPPRRSILFGDEIDLMRKNLNSNSFEKRSNSLHRYSIQGSVFNKSRSTEDHRIVRRVVSSPTPRESNEL